MIAVAKAAQEALDGRNIPLQVAVMGCVVNGPGEAREADLGIAGGRRRRDTCSSRARSSGSSRRPRW